MELLDLQYYMPVLQFILQILYDIMGLVRKVSSVQSSAFGR